MTGTDKAIVQVNLSLMPDDGPVNSKRTQTENADAASRWREETAMRSAFGGASALQLRKYILNGLDRVRPIPLF